MGYKVVLNNIIDVIHSYLSDLKNHQIWKLGLLWRLLEGEQCKISSFSLRYKLFEIPFLTTFVSIKNTLWSNLKYLCCTDLSNLGIFLIWNFLATPGGRTIHLRGLVNGHGYQYCLNDIFDKFYFDYKAVQIDYKAVFYFRWK